MRVIGTSAAWQVLAAKDFLVQADPLDHATILCIAVLYRELLNTMMQDDIGAVWQVLAAKDFLVRADPLKHVAPVRKSSVQHKLCDMLINILGANVTADLPRYVACQ